MRQLSTAILTTLVTVAVSCSDDDGNQGPSQTVATGGVYAGTGGAYPVTGGTLPTTGGTAATPATGGLGGGCLDLCVVGQTECFGNAVRTCATQTTGCADWNAPVACSAGESCQTGACIAGCVDACSVGTFQCSGIQIQECTAGANGCAGWAAAQDCPTGETCNGGQCTTTCVDICTESSTQCSGSMIQTCVRQANGCTDWNPATDCPTNQACMGDECMTSCTDRCTENETRCSGTDLQTCTRQATGCTDWNAPESCPWGETCQGNQCAAEGTGGVGTGGVGTGGVGTGGVGTGGVGTGGSGACVAQSPPSEYQQTLDLTWQEMIGGFQGQTGARPVNGGVQNFTNLIMDQLFASDGKLRYCVRWDTTRQATADVRDKIAPALQRNINLWFSELYGHDCYPFSQEIQVEVVGWAVRNRSQLEWDDGIVPIYVNDIREDAPQCAEACGRFFHRDPGYQYPSCTGGFDNHYDMSIWLTDGFGGGVGGDWGQRVSPETLLNSIDGTNMIIIHEMGHGFGFPDYYNWNVWAPGVQTPNSVMVAGAAWTVTDWDAWMMRRMWSELKDRWQ